MTFTPVIKFWLIVALQVCIILGIVMVKESALTSGRTMLVEIAPVDPRDPFRGDFLVYQLASFSSLKGEITSGEVFYPGQIVYVPMRISFQHPTLNQSIMIPDLLRRVTSVEPRDGSVYLRGRVQTFTHAQLTVQYGIEEFFIPEGSGRTFTFANKEAMLYISLGPDGTALIKELYIDGRSWSEQ